MLKTLCIFLALLTGSATAAETIVTVGAYITVETIDTSISGVYIANGWSYTYVQTMFNTQKAGSWGVLIYDNKILGHTAKVNDWHTTPWGPLYWWGVRPYPVAGKHLWQPVPNEGLLMGKRLDPEDDVYKP